MRKNWPRWFHRSMKVMKQQVYQALFQSLGEAIDTANQELLKSFRSEDFKEGVAHFVEKRARRLQGGNFSASLRDKTIERASHVSGGRFSVTSPTNVGGSLFNVGGSQMLHERLAELTGLARWAFGTAFTFGAGVQSKLLPMCIVSQKCLRQ